MRKLLVLVLALTMALSLAAPALAFTDVDYEDTSDSPSLAIKLVDVTDGFVSINFSAPPSNRGYLKNEVVCAVVSLYVPKDYVFPDHGYTELVFSGKNVSLLQDNNFYSQTGLLSYMSSNASSAFAAATTPASDVFAYAANMSVDNTITLISRGLYLLDNPSQNATYHFAIFGKVLADDATMKVQLKGTGALVNANVATANTAPTVNDDFIFVNVSKDYWVGMYDPNSNGAQTLPVGARTDPSSATSATTFPVTTIANTTRTPNLIPLGPTDILYYVMLESPRGVYQDEEIFAIVVDKNFVCTGMYVFDGAIWYEVREVTVAANQRDPLASAYSNEFACFVEFAFVDAATNTQLLRTASGPSQLAALCDAILAKDFGLNVSIQGKMKPEWWAVNGGLEAEIAVEPWYAEVTVPAEIELEAPKTGDVVSTLGFVLVALAGVAFVAMKKVRA